MGLEGELARTHTAVWGELIFTHTSHQDCSTRPHTQTHTHTHTNGYIHISTNTQVQNVVIITSIFIYISIVCVTRDICCIREKDPLWCRPCLDAPLPPLLPLSWNSPHPSHNSPVGLTRGWSSRWCTCGWFHSACEGVTRTPRHCWRRRAQLWCQLGVRGLNHRGERNGGQESEAWTSFPFFFSVCTVNRVNSVKHEQIWEICQFVVFLPFKLLKHKR